MTKLDADRMTYKQAVQISKKLPEYKNLLPAGSVASKQPNPQDLDFLTMVDLDKLFEKFSKKYKKIWHKTRLGKKRFDYYPIINGKKIVINIWKVTEDNFPFMYFTYGYPRAFVIAMRKKAKNMGYKLSQYGIFKGKNKLKIHKLKDIFKFFKIPPRTPREQYLKHLPKKKK